MPIISIVYFSQSCTTELLAEAVARGAREVRGAEVRRFRIRGEQIRDGRWQDEAVLQHLAESDAIVFGAPTFMGGPAAQFKAFADATGGLWYQRAWKDKLAGGFTISASPAGDQLHTLAYFSVLAAQHGMHWISWDELPRQPDGANRLGASLGLAAQNPAPPGTPAALDPADARSAEKYGRRVADLAQRLRWRLPGAQAA